MIEFDGVEIFSATKANDRESLSDEITGWIAKHKNLVKVVDRDVRQSSDNAFHCLTIILYYVKRK